MSCILLTLQDKQIGSEYLNSSSCLIKNKICLSKWENELAKSINNIELLSFSKFENMEKNKFDHAR